MPSLNIMMFIVVFSFFVSSRVLLIAPSIKFMPNIAIVVIVAAVTCFEPLPGEVVGMIGILHGVYGGKFSATWRLHDSSKKGPPISK